MAARAEINHRFISPPVSVYTSQSLSDSNKDNIDNSEVKQRRLKSARLIGEYEKPWIQNSIYKKREIWDKVIFYGCIVIGFCLGGILCYFSYTSVEKHQYCLVFDDDFQSPNWRDNWNFEVEAGGYGVGSFDWTTADPLNTYADSAGLHIVPTLTLDVTNITYPEMMNGYTLNLTASGECTSTVPTDCVVQSNATTQTIINPVRSARITTQGKNTITYGRIEVVAKLPRGDWLWPAIWMLPEGDVYGGWPKSGEIDLMEARGNSRATYNWNGGGREMTIATFHWGLNFVTDMFQLSTHQTELRRGDYSDAFHTFGLEWSEGYMYCYIDNRLQQTEFIAFGSKLGTMWERGKFEKLGYPADEDPWSQTGKFNTPFDQAFYLILNVAVGGTAGFFKDGECGKPWVDGSESAALDFLNAESTWLPTWGEGDLRGMTVKSVKMWQQGACGS